jgi:hypothetical protein
MSFVYDGQIDWVDPVNRLHWLNRDLEAWYLALPGMGGSSWQDLTKAHDAEFVNGPLFVNTQDRLGGFGSVEFDGDDDRADTGTIAAVMIGAELSPFTICMQVYFRTITSNDRIFGSDGVSPGRFYISTQAASVFWGLGSKFGNLSSNAVVTGVWTHLVWTFSGTIIKFYLDGIQTETYDFSGDSLTWGSDTILIGDIPGASSQPMDGYLDDIRILRRAISPEEVIEVCNESSLGHPGTLNRIESISYAEPEAGGTPTSRRLPRGELRGILRGVV